MCKNIFERNIINVHSKFSCMRSSHGLCVRAHAYCLEGTLSLIRFLHMNSHIQYKSPTWSGVSHSVFCFFPSHTSRSTHFIEYELPRRDRRNLGNEIKCEWQK